MNYKSPIFNVVDLPEQDVLTTSDNGGSSNNNNNHQGGGHFDTPIIPI